MIDQLNITDEEVRIILCEFYLLHGIREILMLDVYEHCTKNGILNSAMKNVIESDFSTKSYYEGTTNLSRDYPLNYKNLKLNQKAIDFLKGYRYAADKC